MNPERKNPQRILVRGVNWLGDAVMTTPALMRLREALPAAHISLLTPEKLADLWHHHPAVDEVYVLDQRESLWSVGRQLRGEGFSAAVALPNSHRSALELWWARIPRRIGYAAPVRSWFLTDAIRRPSGHVRMRKRKPSEIRSLLADGGTVPPDPIPPEAHHLRYYLPLMGPLGGRLDPLAPRLEVSQSETRTAVQKFAPESHPLHPLVALNAGAEYGPAKRWPLERFAAVAAAVHRRIPCHWLLLGGKGDVALTADLGERLRRDGLAFSDIAGKTTLRELCCVLRGSRALLTNDTGPMHVAAALGTPVIALFGSTSPELTAPGFPGDPSHRLLRASTPCSPCFLRECPVDFPCMRRLEVETVVGAVLDVLVQGPKN
jgi:heptosyltransferase-2